LARGYKHIRAPFTDSVRRLPDLSRSQRTNYVNSRQPRRVAGGGRWPAGTYHPGALDISGKADISPVSRGDMRGMADPDGTSA